MISLVLFFRKPGVTQTKHKNFYAFKSEASASLLLTVPQSLHLGRLKYA
jgi:hypothetical protein